MKVKDAEIRELTSQCQWHRHQASSGSADTDTQFNDLKVSHMTDIKDLHVSYAKGNGILQGKVDLLTEQLALVRHHIPDNSSSSPFERHDHWSHGNFGQHRYCDKTHGTAEEEEDDDEHEDGSLDPCFCSALIP